ncbi:MAG: hypothetical protein IJ350_01295 [Clostridia bacterium]|nr:hypothetical protein [Clostridia bacterium]
MKRLIAAVLALGMCLLSCPALASSVHTSTYALAPANPTQENVREIQAAYQAEAPSPFHLITIEPTQLTVETLKDIFDFVDVDKRPPAQYFPEDVQEEMARIISGDPDRLYMPEFMSVMPETMQLDADVLVELHMHIDYRQGQLVLPVLGRETPEGIEWKPLPAQVIEQKADDNIIRFTVPGDVAARYAGAETLLAILCEKPGSGANAGGQTEPAKDGFVPSKNASDIVYVASSNARNASGEAVDCQIVIVPKTQPIELELGRLTNYFTQPTKAPIRYFDEETVHETMLILSEANVDTLLPYEITQVMVEGYVETYGDVTAQLLFPTPFTASKAIIAMIGIPDAQDETIFHWMPLHAEKALHGIDITFSSSVLPTMMTDAALLLVMSEPIEE